jgi:predicted MPP superfamily phosphohydrolase
MGSTGQDSNIIKSGIYSQKQLLVSTIIGGTSIAGFIIACNLWAVKRKFLAIIPAAFGLMLEIILMLPGYFTIRHIHSLALRNILAIILLLILQTIFAFLFRFYISRNRRFGALVLPEIDIKIYHDRKLFPIIIISIIYFFMNFAFFYKSWIIMGIYLLPHFYAYIIIHKTFVVNRIEKFCLISVFLLACLFPFVQTADEYLFAFAHKGFLWYTYLNVIVGYYAVFILYMFVFILGFNLILLLNRIIRFIPQHILTNKIVILITVITSMLSGVTILIIGTHINNNPVVRRYSITLPKKTSTLNSLKVSSVSDLHLKNITSKDFLIKLVHKIQAENPDIILIPGDIAETYGNTTKENLNEYIEILKDLSAKYGIFAVRGNHEYIGDLAEKLDFYKRSGITMLSDSLIELNSKICIIGLKYRGNHEKRPTASMLKLKKQDLPVLLLDHAPYCLEDSYNNKIDAQFSGHTHNGQIWPLNYILGALYDIVCGYKKIDNTNFFVSCGAQDAIMPGRQDLSVPVRTGSVSEIMEININFK